MSIFSGGELYIASAVIAADALGCFIKTLAFKNFGVSFTKEKGVCWLWAFASLVLLILVAGLEGKAMQRHRAETSSRIIPPDALHSIVWFLVTCVRLVYGGGLGGSLVSRILCHAGMHHLA